MPKVTVTLKLTTTTEMLNGLSEPQMLAKCRELALHEPMRIVAFESAKDESVFKDFPYEPECEVGKAVGDPHKIHSGKLYLARPILHGTTAADRFVCCTSHYISHCYNDKLPEVYVRQISNDWKKVR